MKKPKMPSIPDPIAPPNQQASRAPERTAMMAANAGAARYGGNRSTFLTGASGIDSSTLNLGRNTLLGQ